MKRVIDTDFTPEEAEPGQNCSSGDHCFPCLHAFFFFFNFGNVFLFLFYFLLFKGTPERYGGSQTRGLIGATAVGLHHSHSNAGSEPHL